MFFFLVVPLWVASVIVGAVMACIPAARRAGVYVVSMSTIAATASFALSTIVLFLTGVIARDAPDWFRFALVASYLAAIPIGGLLGAIAGFVIARQVASVDPLTRSRYKFR